MAIEWDGYLNELGLDLTNEQGLSDQDRHDILLEKTGVDLKGLHNWYYLRKVGAPAPLQKMLSASMALGEDDGTRISFVYSAITAAGEEPKVKTRRKEHDVLNSEGYAARIASSLSSDLRHVTFDGYNRNPRNHLRAINFDITPKTVSYVHNAISAEMVAAEVTRTLNPEVTASANRAVEAWVAAFTQNLPISLRENDIAGIFGNRREPWTLKELHHTLYSSGLGHRTIGSFDPYFNQTRAEYMLSHSDGRLTALQRRLLTAVHKDNLKSAVNSIRNATSVPIDDKSVRIVLQVLLSRQMYTPKR